MSDREAFVSAIAANPADDLPRLVFADWLDEHGDPERAEFIRTQIRWHHADADEQKRLNARAADLFRDHWQRWFGPFLHALDPETDPTRGYESWADGAAASIVPVNDERRVVEMVSVSRGFAARIFLRLALWTERSSVSDAFKVEPVTHLGCRDGLHSPVWSRFTDPALRRVSHLSFLQEWAWDVSAPESTALLEDPHLAGVRSFAFTPDDQGFAGLATVPAWVERFVRSSLAYRLNSLTLNELPAGGVAPLCRPGRLRLESLHLHRTVTPDDLRRLGASELSRTVTDLVLMNCVTDAGVAVLARDDWPRLKELSLGNNSLTAAVLPALAAATFTPRLKRFYLQGNPLFHHSADLSGLRRLADMLDPERLEHLNLSSTGLSHVPDFLAERFGDRVSI